MIVVPAPFRSKLAASRRTVPGSISDFAEGNALREAFIADYEAADLVDAEAVIAVLDQLDRRMQEFGAGRRTQLRCDGGATEWRQARSQPAIASSVSSAC